MEIVLGCFFCLVFNGVFDEFGSDVYLVDVDMVIVVWVVEVVVMKFDNFGLVGFFVMVDVVFDRFVENNFGFFVVDDSGWCCWCWSVRGWRIFFMDRSWFWDVNL